MWTVSKLVNLTCSCPCVSPIIYVGAVVVAKREDPNPVTLTCRSKTDEAVTWKVQRDEMEDVKLENNIRQVGQNLVLTDVDTPELGQYSCWREGEMLSSTYLLLLEDDEDEESGEIRLFPFPFILLLICCKLQKSFRVDESQKLSACLAGWNIIYRLVIL